MIQIVRTPSPFPPAPKMETLVPNTLSPQFPPTKFLFYFPSLSRKTPNFLKFSRGKWPREPKTVAFCSETSFGSLSYGGWDDLRLGGDSVHSGESNQLRNFMNSIGFHDKKNIFVYLLGFVCALAISRVRVSSIIVIPACVIVFAVGFSIGFINGGQVTELSLIGNKKRPKSNGNISVAIEKLRNLMDLFNGFDSQVVNLKDDIRRRIKTNQITVDDLEGYIMTTESISFSALNARTIVQACVDNMLVENEEVEQTLKQNSGKRKKETGRMGFDLLQFMACMFQENLISSKPKKMKDINESTDMEVSENLRGGILAPKVEERSSSSASKGNVVNGHARFSGDNPFMILDRVKQSTDGTRKIKVITENERMDMLETNDGIGTVFDSKDYIFDNNRVKFMENEQISVNTGHRNSVETWTSDDDMLDLDFNVSLKRMRTKASFSQEENFNKINRNYASSDRIDNSKKESYGSHTREKVISEDDPSHTNPQSAHESDVASSPSPKVLDDMVFNRYLMEANVLLKQARESSRHRGNEGDAENALQKSALLLSKAIEMKPMSLLAMGQLGNTYLLHGELKLKVSQELRALLVRSDPSLLEKAKNLKGLDAQIDSKEEVSSVLVDVCQECEALLVKAGRKYRLALSIDGDDMRALYNWGLALSFRAQLIADIGPEAADDADKVFLAAIDKFDAMMSKSNAHAPEALFRWGVALQQRSRLRTRNGREKVKLLQQAKRLYEDALHMDSDNLQVRKALVSCISEMNYRN